VEKARTRRVGMEMRRRGDAAKKKEKLDEKRF
jgi:hypothetical protein